MAFFEFPHTRTYDSDLGWIIKNIKSYNDAIETLNTWIAENTPRIEDLEEFKAALESGDLPEGVQRGIEAWLSVNGLDLIGSLIKTVWFGITDTGYFAAYIPKSWDGLNFGTIQAGELYGHLTLSYD